MTTRKFETLAQNQSNSSAGLRADFYEIHIKGQLDESWTDWLEGMEVKLLDDGGMILSGYLEDQAALLGTLNKLYGLNLALLSVSKTKPKE
jgi:hypothetical protein